ncbi:MAG: sodium:proton antiporter NhaD, partial [Alistipes sp.]|nr:sodium:proton antiporter NhaD [Alistipes sp.]
MIQWMIALFVAGYVLIAIEHKIKINKAAVALLMCGVIWSLFSLAGHAADIASQLVEHLGDTCEILVYLIGAMTIVDLIDMHGGFSVITRLITTHDRRKLMWLLAIIAFFMSAALDNMTTTIIMIMLLRRLVADQRERWVYASLIVIAANSGGAWSPIGDVTTIMLWMRGNVSAGILMRNLFVPALVSVVVPTLVAMRYVARGEERTVAAAGNGVADLPAGVTPQMSRLILITGVASLLFVPVFKSITGLPPYMGMMVSLGAMWVLTEIVYDRRNIEESIQNRVSRVVKHIDMPTILFFLGILMSVAALQSAGVLSDLADWFDRRIHEVFAVAGVIGLLSSVVDNVPLVAACMCMY